MNWLTDPRVPLLTILYYGAWAAIVVLAVRLGIRAWQDAGRRLAAIAEEFKPPAAGGPQVPPETPGGSAPLPGLPPGPAGLGPQPVPGHTCGPVTGGIGFNEEGCLHFWDALTQTWVLRRHTRYMQFDAAAWEAKLHD